MVLPVLAVAAVLASPVIDAQLDKLVDSVLPTASEDAWLKIPWRSSLTKARVEAQESGKPLFLWMMNGNPLGST